MKNTVFALMTAMLISTPFAKTPLSEESQPNEAFQKTTQAALPGGGIYPKPFARLSLSHELQRHLLELDRLEDKAHVDLERAEQDELMGKITPDKLKAISDKYNAAKEALQAELSKLPNRVEIEQWLIDNHVGVGE